MLKRIAAFILLFLFSSAYVCAAESKIPQMRYTTLFNYDIRHPREENFYSNRIEAFFKKEFNVTANYKVYGRIAPFAEVRHSVKRRKKERFSLGTEFGLEPLSFLYLGEQLRYVWRSEPVYKRGVISNTDMAEGVSIITLSRQLVPQKDILKGYISGEYTYDFRKGSGSRIESLAGVIAALSKSWEANLDWRHRDRIHFDDCDTFEVSCSYNF